MSVQADIIHDFVKSDDERPDILGIEESFARALAATSSAPNGPVDLCYDFDIQEADPGGIRPARKRPVCQPHAGREHIVSAHRVAIARRPR